MPLTKTSLRVPKHGVSPLSLVDAILHSIITDPDIKVDAILTFNRSDFGIVCSERGIEIL